MAEVVEAPLKRKLEAPTEAAECKKPRDGVSLHPDAVQPALGNSQEALAQSDSEHKQLSDAQVNFSGEIGAEAVDIDESKNDRDSEFRLHEQAPGSSSLHAEEPGAVRLGEVIEQDEEDEDDNVGEMSELDTENGSDDGDEHEDSGSDEDEDGSDDDSDNDEEEDLLLTGTSSSLPADIHKGKGKENIEDVKGKGILPLDKGKGKAIAEDEFVPESDEEDAGYLSEDPLEEVDLNNILPSRTRRRNSSQHYDFVDQGGDDDDDDDSDA